MNSSKPDNEQRVFQLGEFRIDPQRRIIFGPGGETTVEPKVMAVLLMLAGRPGQVVTRQEFLDTIWAQEFSGDESLTRAVSHLRKVLGDGRGVHRYIETVPKTGYRLVAPVGPAQAGTSQAKRGWKIAAGLAVVLAAAVALNYWSPRMESSDPGLAFDGQPPMLLAVLPFDSQGDTTEDAQLAQGLSQEIESTLRQSPATPVIVGRYPPQLIGAARQDLSLLSRQFNISHVIDGAVQRSGDGLRVVVRLVDTRTGQEVWSDEVSRPETELHAIPGMVATGVQSALGADPVVASPRAQSTDPFVYEGYLQAKALARTATGENLASAVTILEKAVEMDPSFSEAWAALAWARFNLFHVAGSGEADYGGESNRERIRAARSNANTALAIDPNSLDAQLMVAVISLMEEADTLVESESRLLSLLAASPNHPNANFRMGLFLMSVGRWQESVEVARTALELDPFSTLTGTYYSIALKSSGRTEEFEKFIDIIDGHFYYRRNYAWLIDQLLAGDYRAARNFFDPWGPNVMFFTRGMGLPDNIDPDSSRGARLNALVGRLADVAENGDPGTDPALGSDWVLAADEGLIAYHWVVGLLSAAGVNGAALDLVRDRIALGEVWYRELLLMPSFRSARKDPRIMTLFDLTGQLEYWTQTGKWPDFCAAPDIPYDCESVARDDLETLAR